MNVFKSRWGYHPCSFESFLVYKRLAKIALKSLMDNAKHRRWLRKEPQNRVITVCPPGKSKRYTSHEDRTFVPCPEPPVGVFIDSIAWRILSDYRSVRFPRESELDVKLLRLALSESELREIREVLDVVSV